MHYGKLRCLGSQTRLKTKFGSGYQLQFDSKKGKVQGQLSGLNDCILFNVLFKLCLILTRAYIEM